MSNATDTHAWLGIELRHLAALHAVHDERSFVRAGRRLGYTQSAISNQIAALERLVGARLVERARGGGSVALTETGRVLYEHAAALMVRLQAARTDVAACSAGRAAVLRLGYCRTLAPVFLPLAAGAFAAASAGVRLEPEPGEPAALERAVADAELDAALVPAAGGGDSLAGTTLLDDPFVLVAPAGRPLSPAAGAGPPVFAGPPCAAQLEHEEALLRRTGSPVARLDDPAAIQALAAAGRAYGLLPSLAVAPAPAVDVQLLSGPARALRLVWHRDGAARGLDVLVESVRSAAAQLAGASRSAA